MLQVNEDNEVDDEVDPFQLREENVNELKSRGLVDGDLTVVDYINIDFEVRLKETCAITDREILDFYFNQQICWERRGDRRRVKRCTSQKPNLSETQNAIELLECWSLFDNSGCETIQSLNHIIKEIWQTLFRKKNNKKIHNFWEKSLKILLFYKGQIYSKCLLLFYTLVLWKSDSTLK